jgi:menaquinone-dependent protoporphyrinogen oxidase
MAAILNRRQLLALAAGTALMSRSAQSEANRRILIAYATRCGSTLEIARAVLQDLKARGCAVDLHPADKVPSLAPYKAVVLGSAVRFGKWLPEAVDFVRAHQSELKRVPTVFFTVHIQNTGPDEAARKARLAYIEPVRALLKPQAEAFFAGKIDLSRLSFGVRMIARIMKARDEDRRDWPAIHAWAKTILI